MAGAMHWNFGGAWAGVLQSAGRVGQCGGWLRPRKEDFAW